MLSSIFKMFRPSLLTRVGRAVVPVAVDLTVTVATSIVAYEATRAWAAWTARRAETEVYGAAVK